MEHYLAQATAAASPRQSLAFLLIDLDNFRSVNQALGHAAGDALLAQVSRRLHDVIQRDDAFGHMGGDEFALVLGRLRNSAPKPPRSHEG